MTHHVPAQFEAPDLLAIDYLRIRNFYSKVRLDRRGLAGLVAQQAVEDHVDDRPVVAGRRPVRITGAKVGRVDAEPQHTRRGLAAPGRQDQKDHQQKSSYSRMYRSP